MDESLLILRVACGVLLAGHGCQKLFGWFRGAGMKASAESFESWGLRPGLAMALAAGLSELLGALLIGSGLLLPLGALLVMGAMIVAVAVNRREGLWAQFGGYETALLYGVLALALCAAGPGRYSLEIILSTPRFAGLDVAALTALIALLGSLPIVLMVLAAQRPAARRKAIR